MIIKLVLLISWFVILENLYIRGESLAQIGLLMRILKLLIHYFIFTVMNLPKGHTLILTFHSWYRKIPMAVPFKKILFSVFIWKQFLLIFHDLYILEKCVMGICSRAEKWYVTWYDSYTKMFSLSCTTSFSQF